MTNWVLFCCPVWQDLGIGGSVILSTEMDCVSLSCSLSVTAICWGIGQAGEKETLGVMRQSIAIPRAMSILSVKLRPTRQQNGNSE